MQSNIYLFCICLFSILCRSGPNVYLPNKKRRPFIFAVSWLFSLEDKLIFSSILLVTKTTYRCKKPADYYFFFSLYTSVSFVYHQKCLLLLLLHLHEGGSKLTIQLNSYANCLSCLKTVYWFKDINENGKYIIPINTNESR